MKLKLLLLLLFVTSGVLSLKAQYDYVYNPDTIKSLVISETRIDQTHYSYIELSNVGDEAINLATFELGSLDAWTASWGTKDEPNPDHAVSENRRVKLPNKILWPGECFVAMTIYDLPGNIKHLDPETWEGRQETRLDYWELADLQVHTAETGWGNQYATMKKPDGSAMDSVSPYGSALLDTWSGRSCFYIRQHLSESDSLVVDEVNGNFTDDDMTTPNGGNTDVAGVEAATANSILVRKYTVKEGDLFGDNWQDQVGVDVEDSQWIPIPVPRTPWGPEGIKIWSFWTIGNHGNYTLNQESFQSDVIDVNFTDTVMTVPWGTRNDYKIMQYFEKSPGIAWNYELSPNREDSSFTSARTGDVLHLYACGNTMEKWDFDIVVADPTDDANLVIPKTTFNVGNNTYNQDGFCNVTIGAFGMDTIYNVGFATRIDTLLKYLEKAPEASWKVETVDGVNRPDLKLGDKLVVTAKDGSKKTYYVKVDEFLPNHNAYLSAITWPDIPDLYRGILGWTGDTIPGFSPAQLSYTISVPSDVDGVPALIARAEELNTTVEIERVSNLFGSPAQRTATITSIAEDDSTRLEYKITMEKQKAPDEIQPWAGEPFLSQRAMRAYWGPSAWEIVNPGNQYLDLSNYMIVKGGEDGTPAAALQANMTVDDWGNRFTKYIPGYVWQSEAEWQVNPGILVPDDGAVDPMVAPGDVFVMAALGADNYANYSRPSKIGAFDVDVDFWNNPWGDTTLTMWSGNQPIQAWWGNSYYLFKMTDDPLVRDSIKSGKKSVFDPEDWTLLDVFGTGDGVRWNIGGHDADQVERYIRKPAVWHGNPEYGAAFGDGDADASEWTWENRGSFNQLGYGWDADVMMPFAGLGVHTFEPYTGYRSYITSSVYKVSRGYTDETIKGIVTGTTVDEMSANLNKEDEGQVFTVKSGETVLAGTDAVNDGDVLTVVSADGENETPYTLLVSDGGLGSDAKLVSDTYTVSESGAAGMIEGIAWDTKLADAVANVSLSDPNATMTVVDDMDKYAPMQVLRKDTTYAPTLVGDNINIEVVAEDGVTTILYELVITADESAAWVTSSVYEVNQETANIMYVPRGTAVSVLLGNLVPAPGASVKVVDKYGNERTMDAVYQDDKVVVTAADGVTVKTYYMSMLVTRADKGEVVDYLAYVLSDVYDVDQVALSISGGISGDDMRADFIGNLIPAPGAVIAVLTADGIESTTDDLNQGDEVQVTAMDGETVVKYAIEFATSVDQLSNDNIQVYPNPTSGKVNITGIENGTRIRVFNSTGANISDFVATSNRTEISLDGQSSGMYFIMVDSASFKVVKK